MRSRRILFVVTLLTALLGIMALAYALPSQDIPTIPHPRQDHEECLTCHGPDEEDPFPEDHAGRTDDICLTCHQAAEEQSAEETGATPSIPHSTEGRDDCLACHAEGGLKPFPEDHAGRTNDICLACHQAAEEQSAEGTPTPPVMPHPVEDQEDCLACHAAGGAAPFPEGHAGRDNTTCLACHQVQENQDIPKIPHPIEGRSDCLVCHDIGLLRPFPQDHKGRNNAHCQMCHELGPVAEPTPTPIPTSSLPPSAGIVPTPIHEPVMFEENTCITCHQELGGKHAHITLNWTQSVHAERGVGCVSCHGGDPTKTEAQEAMSPEAGYLGRPSRKDIPNLCGSCHARVELMRPYDLPTDQLSQYWQSFHGEALLEGDPNVATCFDCHGGHRTLKISDPASEVYPRNEPAMCGRCHADEALMAPYGLPTNQYDLYQESVHGIAMLQKQDLRAPTCSTCHGKHGAAPPGLQEVANVCGQCHSATEDYYLQGGHRTGMTGEAAPHCITCHGNHDVAPATRDLLLGMKNPQEQSCGSCHAPGKEGRHCGSCHAPGTEIAGQVDLMYQVMEEANAVHEEAEATIAHAAEQRLIIAGQEELLQRAQTPLIELRALQHNVNLVDIQAKAEESMDLSRQAQASAEKALQEVETRRLGMIVALGVILITVVALALIKRELDRELEAQRARRQVGDLTPQAK